MSEIKKIVFNPGTPGEQEFTVGFHQPFSNMGDVDGIVEWFHPANDNLYIEIYVEGKLYARYHNVPYAAFYQ